jgi:N-methylhydantoinase B/acetone carboxylase alpha subunit
MTFMGNEEASLLKTAQPDVTFSIAGMSGGYPGSTKYAVRAHDTDLLQRAREGEPYPVGDTPPGSFEEDVDGDIVRTERGTYFPKQFDNYDLVHFQMGGGPGWGDPLDRPLSKVVEDVEDQVFSPGTVEDVYGVVGEFDEDALDFEVDDAATDEAREAIRERREAESMTYDEFYEQERERVAEGDVSDQVATMYDEVFDISEAFAEEFEAFWGTRGAL